MGRPDYTRGGTVQAVSGDQQDTFSGAVGAAWSELALADVTTPMQWTIKNTGSADMHVGLGEEVTAHTLEPGESWTVPWAGSIHVQRAGGTDTTTQVSVVGL